MAERSYSLDELAAESGVNARTLRSWVTSKVLPKPIGQGRGARYSANHLLLRASSRSCASAATHCRKSAVASAR